MKKIFATIIIALAIVAASQIPQVKYRKEIYQIALRDSVKLYTVVYTPRWGNNHPILIQRTPYSVSPYDSKVTLDLIKDAYTRPYALRGYILVYQDVRGRFMSEGEYQNIKPMSEPVNEATDAYDTVEWLVANIKGNNGNVGFTGCSYPGFYAMYAALSGHPAIKAVSPQAPVTDWFMGDDLHHNGVMMIADSFSFMPMMSHTNHTPTTEWLPTRHHDYDPDQYTFFLNATRDSLRKVMSPSSFWDEISAHPDYDEWWQQRDVRRYMHNIKPAILVVGGTFDAEDCFGAWNTFRAIRSQSPQTECHLIMGPWAHGAWKGRNAQKLGDFDFGRKAANHHYMHNYELPFFEYHLRGKGSLKKLPEVALFATGSNRWIEGSEIPQSTPKTLYLDHHNLCEKAPEQPHSLCYKSDPESPVPYAPNSKRRTREYMIADQRFTEGRNDVLTYISEPLKEDITAVGGVEVCLNISCSTTDVDLAVRVIDLHPTDKSEKSEYQMLVRGDIMRARYRDSFVHPTPLQPDTKTTVRFTLPDIVHTFKAGHKIMVCVQSSWYPLAERSPQQFVNLWHCTADQFIAANVHIHNDSTIKFNTL